MNYKRIVQKLRSKAKLIIMKLVSMSFVNLFHITIIVLILLPLISSSILAAIDFTVVKQLHQIYVEAVNNVNPLIFVRIRFLQIKSFLIMNKIKYFVNAFIDQVLSKGMFESVRILSV